MGKNEMKRVKSTDSTSRLHGVFRARANYRYDLRLLALTYTSSGRERERKGRRKRGKERGKEREGRRERESGSHSKARLRLTRSKLKPVAQENSLIGTQWRWLRRNVYGKLTKLSTLFLFNRIIQLDVNKRA